MRYADYMDSSALGMLLLLREHVKADKNKLTIVNCPQGILSVLKIANLDKMISIS
jgi:anti-anti-sigma factor